MNCTYKDCYSPATHRLVNHAGEHEIGGELCEDHAVRTIEHYAEEGETFRLQSLKTEKCRSGADVRYGDGMDPETKEAWIKRFLPEDIYRRIRGPK